MQNGAMRRIRRSVSSAGKSRDRNFKNAQSFFSLTRNALVQNLQSCFRTYNRKLYRLEGSYPANEKRARPKLRFAQSISLESTLCTG